MNVALALHSQDKLHLVMICYHFIYPFICFYFLRVFCVCSFSASLSVFSNHDNADFIRWVRKCSLFLYIFESFVWNRYYFFHKCLVQFTLKSSQPVCCTIFNYRVSFQSRYRILQDIYSFLDKLCHFVYFRECDYFI